ncbi:MAG: autotransporter outer membrane beta-barrel domain-containing protein, partial [Bacillota bacterium]
AASGVALSAKMAIAVLGYGQMDEIRKRLGDLRLGSQVDDDVWVRSYGAKFAVEPKGGARFEQQVRGLEVGKGNSSTFNGGKKFFGFLAGTAKGDNSFAITGTGKTDSKYLGVYGSWLRDDGAYFNLIGMNSRYDSSFATGSDSAKDLSNTGWGLSTEIGKRFERGGGAFIEPQAGLSAMWFSKDHYVTSSGLVVDSPAARSLLLRLGLTVGKRSQMSNGTGRQIYGRINWVHEYAYEGRTVVNQAVFDPSLKGSQWVAGVGFEQNNGRNQIYINLEKAWGSTVSKSWGAVIGSRWNF